MGRVGLAFERHAGIPTVRDGGAWGVERVDDQFGSQPFDLPPPAHRKVIQREGGKRIVCKGGRARRETRAG